MLLEKTFIKLNQVSTVSEVKSLNGCWWSILSVTGNWKEINLRLRKPNVSWLVRSEYSADVQIDYWQSCNGAVRGSGCWWDIDWGRQTSCHLVNSIRTTNTATVRCWLVLWRRTLVISAKSTVVGSDCDSLQSWAVQFIIPT